MRFKKSEYYGAVLNILLTCIYGWYLFRTVLRAPGHALFGAGGDGGKNYYTYLYHVLYGKGFHFEGMNYPWGEHISFTDNQPLLAWPLAQLQSVFHFSVNDLLLIMNMLIILSLIATSYLLFRFFSRLGVQPWMGAIFGLLITFLAPNFYRIFGHYGLCYSFNIVLTFSFLFSFQQSGRKRYLFYLFVLCFLMAFVHMYNLLLSMVIIFFYVVVAFLIEKKSLREKAISAMWLFTVVVISFVAVKMVFYFTDPIQDRPVSPWGILHYVSSLKQFFTSEYSSLGKSFSLLFNGFATNDLDEGYAYVGVVSLLYVLFILLNLVFYFFRKKTVNLFTPVSTSEQYLLLIALFSYLMAIGFPFTFGMSFLLDWMPSLRQFRSLGRISVITYFSLAMACTHRLSAIMHDFHKQKMILPAIYLSLLVIFGWSIEMFSYSKYVQHRSDETQSNYKNFFMLDAAAEAVPLVKDTNYQCILGLPFFCIGSEKVGKDVDSELSGDLFNISLRTGLPIVNTLMSRSSWKQSFQLMRLAGGEFTDKQYFSNSINAKPILLVRLKEAYMTVDEQSLMKLCDSVSEAGRLIFYKLDWQALMRYQAAQIDSLNHMAISAFAPATDEIVLSEHYDHTSKEKLFGKGALDISATDTLVLFDQSFANSGAKKFEFSVWARVVSEDYRMPHCSITTYDSSGNELQNTLAHTQHSVDNYGFWFRTSAEITLEPTVRRMRIVFRNGSDHAALYLDEFLLKSLSALVVFEDEEKKVRMYNNHIIHLK